MIYSYDLCGLAIQMESEEPLHLIGPLELFRGAEQAEPDAVYRLEWYDEVPEISGRRVVEQWGYTVDAEGDEFVYRYNVGYERNPHTILLRMDPGKDEYELLLPRKHRELLMGEGLDLAPLLGQELLFIRNQRLMIHSSFVRHQGKALLFTGPSGMGKSTQARLWEKFMGAETLNGDKTVLHLGETEIMAYGSPYAGTSGIYRKESAPLAAIVSLRQGTENTIRRLQPREALRELMPRMAVARWADQWHLKAMDHAIDLVKKTPVYLLSCRPDQGAVELVNQKIFGEGEK